MPRKGGVKGELFYRQNFSSTRPNGSKYGLIHLLCTPPTNWTVLFPRTMKGM